TPRSAAGSPGIPATTSTSRRPTRPGSIRLSAGLRSSRSAPSAAGPLPASRSSWPRSISSCSTTIATLAPSSGPPPRIRSSGRSSDFAPLLTGHDTRSNEWRDASPQALLDWVDRVREPFRDTDDSATKTDQFRRVVRFFRRWDDVAMAQEAKSKPSGLCFVLLAAKYLLTPRRFPDGTPDDRGALEVLAAGI